MSKRIEKFLAEHIQANSEAHAQAESALARIRELDDSGQLKGLTRCGRTTCETLIVAGLCTADTLPADWEAAEQMVSAAVEPVVVNKRSVGFQMGKISGAINQWGVVSYHRSDVLPLKGWASMETVSSTVTAGIKQALGAVAERSVGFMETMHRYEPVTVAESPQAA